MITMIDLDTFERVAPSALLFLARVESLPPLAVEVRDGDELFRTDAARYHNCLAVSPYFEGTVTLAISNDHLVAEIAWPDGHCDALALCEAVWPAGIGGGEERPSARECRERPEFPYGEFDDGKRFYGEGGR